MKFWNWLITSSADPENTSLFIKGLLTIGAGYLVQIVDIMCALHVYCLPISQTQLTDIIAAVVVTLHAGLVFFGAIITVVGLIRKVAIGQWSAATR